MNPLHLLWIVPVVSFIGFQVGSIVEYKKGYNFADLEKDILEALEGKLLAEEKVIAHKIAFLLSKVEFWKKA